jgi:D-alanyl-D-alanine carboxypeptidase
MISTMADLDRFLGALLGGRLLRPAEMRRMLTVPDLPYQGGPGDPPRAFRGAGLLRYTFPDGVTVWGHSGEICGYKSGVAATPDLRRRAVYVVNHTHMDQPAPPIVARLQFAVFDPAHMPV